MKYLKLIFAILIVCGIKNLLPAQSNAERKWDAAIMALEKSDFTLKYVANKDSIESQVAYFHRMKAGLRPEEIAEVKKAYEQSVQQFDNLLDRIKEDFADPHDRAYIAKHPDHFAGYLEAELNGAIRFYDNNCKAVMDTYVATAQASIGLMEVGLVITLGKELWSLWNNKQEKAKALSAKYFEERYVRKYRLKKWDHY